MKSRKLKKVLERALNKYEARGSDVSVDIAYALHHVRGRDDDDGEIPSRDEVDSEKAQARRLKKIRGRLINTMLKAAKGALKDAGVKFDYHDLFVYIYNAADHMMEKMAEE